jgi:hypothetical protein
LEIIISMGALSASGAFQIADVQLEASPTLGGMATISEKRPPYIDRLLCYRYYYSTIIDQTTNYGNGSVINATSALAFVPFPMPMRAAPSALLQSGSAANYNVMTASGGLVACSAVPSFNSSSQTAALVNLTTAGGLSSSTPCYGQQTGAGAFLAWSAEL